MKTAVKIFAVMIAAVLALGMAGCSTSSKKLNIGIVQLIAHNALDASREGFIKALADAGYTDGDNIVIDFRDAMGDMNNLSTISDRFVNNKADLVLAITTPAVLAMAAKTETIPIVGTAVTSFVDAGLADSDEKPGRNVTGSSDMNPVAAQMGLIKELFPAAKTVGFLYNSGESNSVLQINIAKEEAAKLGLEWTEATVTNTNDVLQALQSLVTKCDAIYLPTDNTVASAMATVGSVADEAKIPTVCGESNMVEEGGLITMGVNYFELGQKAGQMAVEILKGKSPATMPIQYADQSDEIVINGHTAEAIGFVVPAKYQSSVTYP